MILMKNLERPQTRKEKLLHMLDSLSPKARVAILLAAKEQKQEMIKELGEGYNPRVSLRRQWQDHEAKKTKN
jgi:hypothetical protein